MAKISRSAYKKPVLKGPLLMWKSNITRDMLTDGQRQAEDIFKSWFFMKKSKRSQILRIGGQAGSGKDFLIRYLIDKYGFTQENCYVVSYTGQSVNVMRRNGVMGNTIHSMIMVPREEPILDPDTDEPIMKRGVPLTKVKFKPVKSIPKTIQLIIVNEASFLPESLEEILKSYNVPIMEIGDPIQLPPVGGKQVFTMNTLDFFMEGIMRQHKDSELYDLITRLRYCKNINPANYHDEVLFLRAQPTIDETFHRFFPFFRDSDLILTTTNKQRQIITDLYRKEIIKTNSPYPREGERMICRKNNRNLGLGDFILTNGTQGYSMYDVGRSEYDKSTDTYTMSFKPDVVADTELYYDNLICDAEFLRQPFGTDHLTGFQHPGEKFEYAHAITVHLAQGDQRETVLYMDSFFPDPEYLARLRYTAASRAQKRLIYILPYSKYPGWTDLKHIEERGVSLC